MIRSFRHRGLKALYEGKTEKRVSPQHAVKLRDILAILDRSRKPEDMNLPGFGCIRLKANSKGTGPFGCRETGASLFALKQAIHTTLIISIITKGESTHHAIA